MTAFTVCTIVVLVGAVGPALLLAGRGSPINRVIGLQLLSAGVTVVLILLSQTPFGQSYDLTLPLVLVPLSFAGVLVFTRLLAAGDRDDT